MGKAMNVTFVLACLGWYGVYKIQEEQVISRQNALADQVYAEGWNAHRAGKPIEACPYGEEAAYSVREYWMRGWHESK